MPLRLGTWKHATLAACRHAGFRAQRLARRLDRDRSLHRPQCRRYVETVSRCRLPACSVQQERQRDRPVHCLHVGSRSLNRQDPPWFYGKVLARTKPPSVWAILRRYCRTGDRQRNGGQAAIAVSEPGLAWSPEQISRRPRLDFPEDPTMRISHEAIYQALLP